MADMNKLENGDSKDYWEGTRQGRLLFQKCCNCGVVQFPPRHHCASCWHEGHEWIQSSGAGTVESFTVVRRAPTPAFRDQVPYVVASVIVEEGPRMIATLVGDNAFDVRIGEAVNVEFAENDTGNVLPKFRRA